MYDFIIIGAGPAGCTAAAQLAERGLKVLLVEKCRLPRYKSCSGVLNKKIHGFGKALFWGGNPSAYHVYTHR